MHVNSVLVPICVCSHIAFAFATMCTHVLYTVCIINIVSKNSEHLMFFVFASFSIYVVLYGRFLFVCVCMCAYECV